MLGCFEHYATLRQHDSNFSRYLKAEEWLSSYDLLSGEMRSEREYSLMHYLPYMLVPFFPIFQERGGPKVERPKADWEVGYASDVLIHAACSLSCVRPTRGRRLTRKFTSHLRNVSGPRAHGTAARFDILPETKYCN